MLASLCCPGQTFKSLARAAAKAASAQFRKARLLDQAPNWQERIIVCAHCPLRAKHNNDWYCGRPFLSHVNRDVAEEGCGCRCSDKARDPTEHCPRTKYDSPSRQIPNCNCKWCRQ